MRKLLPWCSNGALWAFPMIFLIYLWIFVTAGLLFGAILFVFNLVIPFIMMRVFGRTSDANTGMH